MKPLFFVLGIAISTMNFSIAPDPTLFPFNIKLKDKNQKEFLSKDILKKAGQPTVILFWLTTCGPCARELKALNLNLERWKKQMPFNLVAISEDYDTNFPAFVSRQTNEKWIFPTYWDYNRDFKSVMPGAINGMPQTFIYDKKGKLVYQKKGFIDGDENNFFEKLKSATRS